MTMMTDAAIAHRNVVRSEMAYASITIKTVSKSA